MQLFSFQSRAVGFIAIGAEAHGVFAFGQVAYGVVAVGQMATGMIAIGQLARGWIAIGQGAVGLYAIGQGAVGVFSATGMLAVAARARGLAWSVWPKTELNQPPTTVAFSDLRTGQEVSGWVEFRAKQVDGKVQLKINGEVVKDFALPGDAEAQVLLYRKSKGWLKIERQTSVSPPENAGFRSTPEEKTTLSIQQVKWNRVNEVSVGRWIVTWLVMSLIVGVVAVVSLVPAVRSIYSVFDESYEVE